MPGVYGSQIKGAILKRFGDPGQVIIKDKDIADFINDALVQICRQTGATFQSYQSSAAGAFPQQLESTAIDVVSVMYGGTGLGTSTNGRALAPSSRNDLLEKGHNLQAVGEPDFWYTEMGVGSKVYVYPVPATNDTTPINILYTRVPFVIPADLGTSKYLEIPDAWVPDIVTFAVARCHEVNKDWTAANQLMAQFTTNIGQARHEAMSGDGDSYPVIRDDPGYIDYGWTW